MNNDFNDLYNSLFEGIDENFMNNLSNLTQNLIGSPTIIQKSFSPKNFLKTYLTLATNLNDKSIDILMYLLNNSNEEGIYAGTYDTIINDLQISRNTLANIMTELQSKNLVTKTKDGWKVSSTVNIPTNGQNIVIQFTKSPTKPVEKIKPEFDSENFDKFISEYVTSLNRVLTEDNKFVDNENIKEDVKKLKEEYSNAKTNFSLNNYVKELNDELYKSKNELLKAVNAYTAINKKLKYIADPEDSSIEKTRANYLSLFNSVSELSKDSLVLVKSALIQILDITDILQIRDFQTVEALITNRNGIGTKLAMKAELMLKNRNIRDPRYISAIRYYLQKYETSMAFEYLNAIMVLIKDEYTIVRY